MTCCDFRKNYSTSVPVDPNFFKEAKNPFNAGKMPSEKFRACEAYLQFVVIAYNLFEWFKKNFSPRNGDTIKWRPFES
ncbi:MAG: hypothetical protein B1H13_05755 [Desulfobacteraceae bacterium 4484_190.3]|nr:MAG: hypothetical protein B1H13_05755 [Desulfobacteraceae bacterium 4484_190.3]